MITNLLASSKTSHSLGESSSKEGLERIRIGLMLLMRVDSPFLLGHLQGGEPDGVQVLLHPAHLVQGTPQVAHAVIKILV